MLLKKFKIFGIDIEIYDINFRFQQKIKRKYFFNNIFNIDERKYTSIFSSFLMLFSRYYLFKCVCHYPHIRFSKRIYDVSFFIVIPILFLKSSKKIDILNLLKKISIKSDRYQYNIIFDYNNRKFICQEYKDFRKILSESDILVTSFYSIEDKEKILHFLDKNSINLYSNEQTFNNPRTLFINYTYYLVINNNFSFVSLNNPIPGGTIFTLDEYLLYTKYKSVNKIEKNFKIEWKT